MADRTDAAARALPLPPSFAAYDATRDFSRKSLRSGCYAPFVSLYFNTIGDVVACCKNQTYLLGNVARETLDEIWRGARIGKLREALARYDFGLGCGHCEWQIKGGDYQGVYTRIFEEFPVEASEGSSIPEWPAMMEFTISNTCNFECVMCYGELSSSIRSHREGLPPLAKVYDERFFADLRRYLPHLKRAKFFGGEPFLANENFRVWDAMIELGLKTECHATTNGSIWNERVRRVLDQLPMSISVSIDGATKETFEAIRVNADFEGVMANTRRFRDHTRARGTDFTITFCLMRQNWREFADVLLLAEELGCEVWINTVIDPADSSLFTLPPRELLSIAEEMERSAASKLERFRRNRAVWENVLRNLRDNADERQTKELALVKMEADEARRFAEGVNADHLTPAWELVFAGKPREALAEVSKTEESSPKFWHSLVVRAHIHRLLGDVASSEREIERALERGSRRPEAYCERAWIRLSQGRIDEAVDDAQISLAHARAVGQGLPGSLDALGSALSCKGDAAGASAAFDEFIALQPQSALALCHRGWMFDRFEKSREALTDAEAALRIAPQDGEALRLRAVARAKLGCAAVEELVQESRLREALALLDENPEGTLLFWRSALARAHVLRRLGDLKGAEEALARAAALGPSRPEVEVERASLRLDRERINATAAGSGWKERVDPRSRF